MSATVASVSSALGRQPRPHDVRAAVTRFRRVAAALPCTAVRHRVDAHPDRSTLAALAEAGAWFDVLDLAGLRAALAAGATPGHLVHSGPWVDVEDVRRTADRGVRMFVVDSVEDAWRVAGVARGASVVCRLGSPSTTTDVLCTAHSLGLAPAGVRVEWAGDPGWFDGAVATVAEVFGRLRTVSRQPWLLDVTLPAYDDRDRLPLPYYGASVETAMRRHFGPHRPSVMTGVGCR